MYLAKLGEYTFELSTAAFQQLQRQTGYRWERLARLGRAPAAQFLGAGDDDITLTGSIYPHFRGGLGQVGAMRAQAGKGEALALTYAFERVGQYCGLWCIKQVQETRTLLHKDGTPRRIDFTLALLAYGEDDSQQGGLIQMGAPAAALAAASPLAAAVKAVAGMAPVTPGNAASTLPSAASTVGRLAGAAVQAAQEAQAAITGALSTAAGWVADQIPPQVLGAANTVALAAGELLAAGGDVAAAVRAVGVLPADVRRAAQRLESVASSAGFDSGGSVLALRDAERTLTGVARVSDGAGAMARLQVAQVASTVAGAAEQFAGACDSVRSAAGTVVERIHVV